MALFDRVIMVIYTLALVLLAALVTAVAAGWQAPLFYWDALLLRQDRWVVAVLAAAIALLGLRVIAGLFTPGPPAQTLVQSNPTGDVRISLSAIEHIVGRIARQVRGIREVRPHITTSPEGVAIFVEAAVHPETPISQVTSELQEKVRHQVEEMVGLKVMEVRVLVEDILRERARVR